MRLTFLGRILEQYEANFSVLNFRTIYRGYEPSRNRVVVLARQATKAGGINSLESNPRLLKSLKIPSLVSEPSKLPDADPNGSTC